MIMNLNCLCRTKWWEYSKPFKRKCKRPPKDVTDKLEKAMNQELDKKRSELDGKIAGTMETKCDWYPDGGSIPSVGGGTLPTYSRKCRVCTTSDWFRYRNLKGSYKPSPEPECEDWPDKQPIQFDGNANIISQECNCAKTDSGGVLEGQPETETSEEPNGTENKNTTIEIKIEWEEWAGKTCGELVPEEQTPPDPSENYQGKSQERSTNVNLEWEKFYEVVKFKQNFWIDHECP